MSDVTEVVTDNVEEVIDGVVEVMEVVRTNVPLMIAVGVVGVAAGAVGGYFLARKVLEREFAERLDDEIEETKKFYQSFNKVNDDGVLMTPGDVLRARGVDALGEYQGEIEAEGEPHDDIADEEHIAKMEARIQKMKSKRGDGEETVNIFTDHTFDLSEEVKHRSADVPYVITHDEFYESDPNEEYETQSLVYYEGDSVLCDENDQFVDEDQVGADNLARFGHGSKDRNTVYVRNEKLETDFEITRSEGSYVTEVLDLDPAEAELRAFEIENRRNQPPSNEA